MNDTILAARADAVLKEAQATREASASATDPLVAAQLGAKAGHLFARYEGYLERLTAPAAPEVTHPRALQCGCALNDAGEAVYRRFDTI